jgi:hypothetical protein
MASRNVPSRGTLAKPFSPRVERLSSGVIDRTESCVESGEHRPPGVQPGHGVDQVLETGQEFAGAALFDTGDAI